MIRERTRLNSPSYTIKNNQSIIHLGVDRLTSRILRVRESLESLGQDLLGDGQHGVLHSHSINYAL